MVRPTVKELQGKALPHASFSTLFKGETPEEDKKAIDKYLHAFLVPDKEGKCIRCDIKQGGLSGYFMGFTWGLVHGEGYCQTCGWPARAYHHNFGPVESLTLILQYHPDFLEEVKGDTGQASTREVSREPEEVED